MVRVLVLMLLLLASRAHGSAQDARAHFDEGRARLAEGDQAGARAAFLRAVDASPTWILPWIELGELAVARREGVREAREGLLALDAPVGNPRFFRVLGDLAELDGDDAAAVAAWRTSLEADGRQDELRLRRAAALERLGRPAEAAEEYARILASQPADRVVLARHAHALEAAGDFEAARAALEALVRLQPGKEIPLRRLARFLERRGAHEEARRVHAEADRAANKGPPRKMRPLPPSSR